VKEVLFDICNKEDVVVAGRDPMVAWVMQSNHNNWIWNKYWLDFPFCTNLFITIFFFKNLFKFNNIQGKY
jgi:hypothetical protein